MNLFVSLNRDSGNSFLFDLVFEKSNDWRSIKILYSVLYFKCTIQPHQNVMSSTADSVHLTSQIKLYYSKTYEGGTFHLCPERTVPDFHQEHIVSG